MLECQLLFKGLKWEADMKKTELKIGTATCLILLTVSGIAGITALFLPFAEDISPASFVFNFLILEFSDREGWFYISLWPFLPLAMPFFLSVFVSAAFVRWMISGLLSRPERTIAYVISSTMALGILHFVIYVILENVRTSSATWTTSAIFHFLLILVIPSLLLLFGVYVVIKGLKNKGPKEIGAVMAMQIAYLSNALLCLILWVNTWQIGAYFVVFTSGIYLTQIVMATVKLGVFRSGGESVSV